MTTTTMLISKGPIMLLARRACYRLISLALADPRSGTFEELADPISRPPMLVAAEILRDKGAARGNTLTLGERPLADLDPAKIFSCLPQSAQELNELYEANFGLLGGSKCPPYETEYVPSKFTFQRSNMLADIAGFYNAFGLRPSSSSPDRPDHVVLECEFMAQLLQLQCKAVEERSPESAAHARICESAQRRFLKEHLTWWLPAFAMLLAQQAEGSLYEAVAHFVAAFIASERSLANIEPQQSRAKPTPIEHPDECTGCQLLL
jgi:TorA maturation chaperone TorD